MATTQHPPMTVAESGQAHQYRRGLILGAAS
jgi:hypothetical protein